MLLDDIEREATAANRATASLRDDRVSDALRGAARLVRERRDVILEANVHDCDVAAARLDDGTLDNLRLDDARVESLARQVEVMAEISRSSASSVHGRFPTGSGRWRRIPIGTVGAKTEARPNVALDVAGQLLKSRNTAILRTGSAALRTVTVLVDDVLGTTLEALTCRLGLSASFARPTARSARILVSLPRIPLVILRGSGETTATLTRLAAEHGVRTLAHAEGGAVLYVHRSASRERPRDSRREPRPARGLQPPQPPPRRPRGGGRAPGVARAVRGERDRGARAGRGHASTDRSATVGERSPSAWRP